MQLQHPPQLPLQHPQQLPMGAPLGSFLEELLWVWESQRELWWVLQLHAGPVVGVGAVACHQIDTVWMGCDGYALLLQCRPFVQVHVMQHLLKGWHSTFIWLLRCSLLNQLGIPA